MVTTSRLLLSQRELIRTAEYEVPEIATGRISLVVWSSPSCALSSGRCLNSALSVTRIFGCLVALKAIVLRREREAGSSRSVRPLSDHLMIPQGDGWRTVRRP